MRHSRRSRPQVEGVESRALLSGVPAVAPMIYPPPVLVTGHADGIALIRPSMPDVGNQYELAGVGTMSPMGQVSVQGTIQTSSFSGRPMGTVTLTNPLGSVQLEIVDRESPTEPDTFQFVVTSATGPYTNLQGTGGVLELAVHGEAGAGTFHMDVNPIIPMAT